MVDRWLKSEQQGSMATQTAPGRTYIAAYHRLTVIYTCR